MAKEKSITELKDERNQLLTRGKAILDGAKKETRSLNEGEQREYDGIVLDIRRIGLDILEKEAENRKSATPHVQAGKFSLRKAILAAVEGRAQDGVEASTIEAATALHRSAGHAVGDKALVIPVETRAYTAGTEAATGVVIDQDQQELLLPLEANLVLARAGARFMTGLVGDIYWPSHNAVSVFWQGENATAQDGGGAFSKGTVYQPKRLTAKVDISKQLIIQENRSVEALIRQLIAVAIAQKVEQTAFSTEATTATIPGGLFATTPTISGAMSWENVVGLETAADLNNALFGNLGYIMHPALVGKAKTKVKDASGAGGFIFGNDGAGMLNGYKALRTNNMPEELQAAADEYGIVFANWNDYFIGQWGAIDITVDPYTMATEGMIRLVVNSYWNMGKVRDESFAIASMK